MSKTKDREAAPRWRNDARHVIEVDGREIAPGEDFTSYTYQSGATPLNERARRIRAYYPPKRDKFYDRKAGRFLLLAAMPGPSPQSYEAIDPADAPANAPLWIDDGLYGYAAGLRGDRFVVLHWVMPHHSLTPMNDTAVAIENYYLENHHHEQLPSGPWDFLRSEAYLPKLPPRAPRTPAEAELARRLVAEADRSKSMKALDTYFAQQAESQAAYAAQRKGEP